jgi:hypothetical protein
MKTSTKYEIRRSVRLDLLPRPYWSSETLPECNTNCPLYIDGKCVWSKRVVVGMGPCIPCITKAMERVR